jgi:hypothetical protein
MIMRTIGPPPLTRPTASSRWKESSRFGPGHNSALTTVRGNTRSLSWDAAHSGGRMHLFDAPHPYSFHVASRSGGHDDMRRILDGALMRAMPLQADAFILLRDRAIPASSMPTTAAPPARCPLPLPLPFFP